MKLSRILPLLTLSAAALACTSASASVIAHLHETMQSGATFDGDLTFADGYAELLGVNGMLSGDAYGNDHLGWVWKATVQVPGGNTTNIAGVRNDWLLDGSFDTGYRYYLGVSWDYPADSLVINLSPQLQTYYAGVSDIDRVISAQVGAVPEPASVALLGLGLGAAAVVRRRKR
ncbi:PEP-CTERM sorting domain-containing protein [Massilia sp. 9096]|uniref:PEP-CTERM sorting domain-containing protein n=1 Tax=Massilia sp. 9096 TaxID=1500894 RepID=UPI0005669F9A|nr:PEP-CTERM sorting domain-containing protein [Massilia sp. 9096]